MPHAFASMVTFFYAFGVLSQITGCAQSNFAGANNAQPVKSSAPAAKGEPQEDDELPAPVETKPERPALQKKCDLTKDFVELNYPAAIAACVASGKLYNYHDKKCFDQIDLASSYECNKAALKAAVTKISLGSTFTLGIEAYPSAKLIGCGERRGGKTILFQWWVPPAGVTDAEKCEFSGNMTIGTECYIEQTSGSATIAGPSSTAEGVAACANAN